MAWTKNFRDFDHDILSQKKKMVCSERRILIENCILDNK